MTANQFKAVSLARGILGGTVDAASLPDADWHLLLLAAGLNGRRRAPAMLVAEQVLLLAEHHDGYFARGDGPAKHQRPHQHPCEGW